MARYSILLTDVKGFIITDNTKFKKRLTSFIFLNFALMFGDSMAQW
jgi:hypothetical protein